MLSPKDCFKVELFGYKKATVDFFVSDMLSYMQVLEADIGYLKKYSSELESKISLLELDNISGE